MFRKFIVRLKIYSVLNENIDTVVTYVRASCITNNSNDPEKAKKTLATMMSWLYSDFRDTDITEEEYKEVITPAINAIVDEMVRRG